MITAAAGVQVRTLTRTDSNGSRIPVRTTAGLLPTDPGPEESTLVVEDHEYALTGTIDYTVTGQDTTTGDPVTASATITPTGSAGIEGFLTVPQRPTYDSILFMVTGYEESRPSQTTVHPVIGRPDPLVTIGVLGTRRGTLSLFAPTYYYAQQYAHVYSLGMTVLYRQSDYRDLDLYHVATDSVQIAPYQINQGLPIRWEVRVPYVEVNRPGGPISGSPLWSYDRLALTMPTYDAVVAEYATYDALTVGPLT